MTQLHEQVNEYPTGSPPLASGRILLERPSTFQDGNQQVPQSSGSLPRRQHGEWASAVDSRSRPTSSLGLNPTKSAVWLGDSGEADPRLCRRYHYDNSDECVLSSITYRRIPPDPGAPRQDGYGDVYQEPPVIFMLPDDSLGNKGEPRNEESSIKDGRREVESMVPKEVGDRLFKLFFRFVYP